MSKKKDPLDRKKRKHKRLTTDYKKQKEKHLKKLADEMLENEEHLRKLKDKKSNGDFLKLF